MVDICINGEWRQIRAPTLANLIDELSFNDTVVATALNGEFVPIKDRTSTMLAPDDRIEILAPMQGG